MNLLSVENLSKTYGEKLLFEDLTFGLNQGQKVALIAPNGSGKTTLLNILAGKDDPDTGQVVYRKDIRMAYLSQDPGFDPELSVLDAILSAETEYVRAVRNYEHALAGAEAPGGREALQQAIVTMDALVAWNFEHRVKEVLTRLEIKDTGVRIGSLSGGQQRKVALARVLIDEVDLLLLDEPTNHLDINMIEWMERFLLKQNLSILMVTHDRYFLDSLCDEILELDNQHIYRYQGKYHYYLEKKAERENAEQQEVLKAKNLYRKELEWMRRMPKARTHKSKARIEAFKGLSETARRPMKEEKQELKVKSSRIGNKILEINNLHKSFGDKEVIKDFSHTFKRGEKIGIVGPNGSGKSTFFKLIMGQLKPTMGSIVRGQTVVFGYFSQDYLPVKENKRVIDMVKEVAEEIPVGESSSMSASVFLNYFGFEHNTQYNYFDKLSGGQKRKLQLLLSLVHNPNFLIFDEPTNDLDIKTLDLLEEFLAAYRGCLLIATHDRAFLDNIVDHLFVFDKGGKIKDYHGSYTEYRRKQAQQARAVKIQSSVTSDEPQKPRRKKKKASYKQLKRLEFLEAEIARLEQEKAEITALLEQGSSDLDKITEASTRFSNVEDKLDEIEMEWLELQEEIARYESD